MDDNPYRPGATGQPAKSSLLPRVVTLLAVLGVIGIAVLMMLPARRGAREAGRRTSCMNNLRNIGLALHSYTDTYGALPPAYTTDAEGKPLHSWRTLILPFVGEKELYDSIDLSKPWDDPANAKVGARPFPAFACPSTSKLGNRTTCLAVVTPGSCLRGAQSRDFREIVDGPTATLMLIEVDAEHAVPWMAPLDADEDVLLGISRESQLAHPGGMHGVFVDGHVDLLSAELPAGKRRALATIAGRDNAELE